MGPIIFDLEGYELTLEEKEMLAHPLIGGVILFKKNFDSVEQIAMLTKAIRSARKKPLLITVDHEGGRVQRFKGDLTTIPPMGKLGMLYEKNQLLAIEMAETCGWLIATELNALGIDLSFTPVLDLNKQKNTVIGDRAFHADPNIVIELAKALVNGLHFGGMASCGKHFPGHGEVLVDSHLSLPMDDRNYQTIESHDLKPFQILIKHGIKAIMPAHIIFSEIDSIPAGFSKIWLQKILRQKLQFNGVIFSDDLTMEAAGFAGDFPKRAESALLAGCDFALICNDRQGTINILDKLPREFNVSDEKFKSLIGKKDIEWHAMINSRMWQNKVNSLGKLYE